MIYHFWRQTSSKKKKFLYLKEDITNPTMFENAIKKNKIDIVIHLACISNDPTYELNSELSKKLIMIALKI